MLKLIITCNGSSIPQYLDNLRIFFSASYSGHTENEAAELKLDKEK